MGLVTRKERPALRPEENEVASVLRRVFAGASVDQHDDGRKDSQYDLVISGPVRGAAEVGLVTDQDIRRAQAHWRRALEPHRTADLNWSWTFIFSDLLGQSAGDRFPHLPRPDPKDLTAVLARLEARGIMRIGRMWDHFAVEPGGWRICDSDIAELFRLLGRAAENGSAVDLRRHGETGGWSFSFGFGHTSTREPDQFGAEVEALLHATDRSDMVTKLQQSGQPVTVAALVLDSTTGTGWSTRHLPPGACPKAPMDVPAGVTHVLVIGTNGLTMLYSPDEGWSRHDVEVAETPTPGVT